MIGLERVLVGSDASRVYARKISGACIALGHVSLFTLAVTHRLEFSTPTEYKFLQLAALNEAWLIIHAVCASAIVVSLMLDKMHVQSLSMSAGCMGAWGFISLLGGLTTVRPVSLAGPVLALVLSSVAYSVVMSWAITPPHRRSES